MNSSSAEDETPLRVSFSQPQLDPSSTLSQQMPETLRDPDILIVEEESSTEGLGIIEAPVDSAILLKPPTKRLQTA